MNKEFFKGLNTTPQNTERKVYLSPENAQQFINWITEGNAVKVSKNEYREQTTQWRKIFTLKELKAFFVREFIIQ